MVGWCCDCIHWHEWDESDPRMKLHVVTCGDCDRQTGSWEFYDNWCDDFEERNEDEG